MVRAGGAKAEDTSRSPLFEVVLHQRSITDHETVLGGECLPRATRGEV
jgi:hypothetical protein